jgi:hypothetical protein
MVWPSDVQPHPKHLDSAAVPLASGVLKLGCQSVSQVAVGAAAAIGAPPPSANPNKTIFANARRATQ